MGKKQPNKFFDLKNLHHYPAQILNSQAVHPDPAASFPGAPPLFGKDVVPHIYTVAGWVGSQARAYPLEDEALRDSTENAERMRRHPDIKECLLARQRAVALLPWHLQPEDEHDPVQKQLVADLTSIVERTHRWVELRRNLMEAIWYGKGFVQLRYGVKQVKGRWRKVAADWEPRHPDKILFRYSDGTNEYVPGQVGIRIHAGARGINREQIEPTQYGLAYWLRDFERRVCIVHKHEIEDGPFLDPRASGRIHGVGLRDSVYWTWYASVEVEQKLLEYLDRTALGIEIWRYPSGNKEAEKQARAAAEERIGGGRSIVMVPVIPGEQADLFGVQHIEPGPQGAELLKTICQDFYAHKIKRLILGQTLTSEAESTGMGSGVADAHLATFSDIIRYDAVNLQESLTDDFIQVLKEENFPWARGIHIRLILNTERPETQEKLAAYNEAWNMGLKVRAEDLYALIGARRPDDEDEVLQNPNIMMAEQQQAMLQAQAGMPPPGPDPGDPTQIAMGNAGPVAAGQAAPPMEVEKAAADQPGAMPANPWAGFWDSLFAAARGQGVQPPVGAMPAAPRPVDHMELTRLFQDRFREAILTRQQTAAQFREALEAAIAQQPDRDNLNLRLGFLFAWKKAEPVQKIKAAFQEAITKPGSDLVGPPPVPPVATAAPADDDDVHSVVNQADPVKQQLLDALAENPVNRAFQEAFERQQRPREQLLKALRETVAPDQYAATESPEFKQWWQDSKTTQPETGAPMRLLHVSPHDIEAFQPSDDGELGPGIYATADTDYANSYADYVANYDNGQKRAAPIPVATYPVHMSIQKPYVLHNESAQQKLKHLTGGKSANIQRVLKKMGHDGIMKYDHNGVLSQVVAFHPTQVKSETGNQGSYSSDDDRINYIAASGPNSRLPDSGRGRETNRRPTNERLDAGPAAGGRGTHQVPGVGDPVSQDHHQPDHYTQGPKGIRGSSTAGTPVPPRDPQADESPLVEADRPAPLGDSPKPENPEPEEPKGIKISPASLTPEVLNRISKHMKAKGYDSRGGQDAKRAIESMINRFSGHLTHPDWIEAYQKATGGAKARQAKLEAKKTQQATLKNVNWERLKQLGTTKDYREAGYLAPEGHMIDLSGRGDGYRGPPMRNHDHREAGGTPGMQEIMSAGHIRHMPEMNGLDMMVRPTNKQYAHIRNIADRAGGEVIIDLQDGLGPWNERNGYYDGAERRHNAQYPKGTRADRIIRDIEAFYDGHTPAPPPEARYTAALSMDDAIARYRAGEWTSEDLDRYALQRSFEMVN